MDFHKLLVSEESGDEYDEEHYKGGEDFGDAVAYKKRFTHLCA